MTEKTNGSVKKYLGLDDIVEASDFEVVEIATPEWGTDACVRIGSLSAGDVQEWMEAGRQPDGSYKPTKTDSFRLVLASLIDEDGKHIGDPNDPQQISGISKRRSSVINRILQAIIKLNGLGKEETEQRKNASGEVPTGASPTVLH